MKPLYTKIKITDKSRTDKLKFMDQVRLLISNVGGKNKFKLEDNQKISKQKLQLESSFINLIDNAILSMREQEKWGVTILVSSKFNSVKHLLDSYKLFYTIEVEEDAPEVKGVDYFFKVRIINEDMKEKSKVKEV